MTISWEFGPDGSFAAHDSERNLYAGISPSAPAIIEARITPEAAARRILANAVNFPRNRRITAAAKAILGH